MPRVSLEKVIANAVDGGPLNPYFQVSRESAADSDFFMLQKRLIPYFLLLDDREASGTRRYLPKGGIWCRLS